MFATKMKLTVALALTAAASAVAIGFVVAAAPGQQPKPARVRQQTSAEAPKLAAKLSASGRVIDSDGKPIAAARVILREWSEYRARGMPQPETEKLMEGSEINDILTEIKTDLAGRFRIQGRARAGVLESRRGGPERVSLGHRRPALKATAWPGCR